MRYVKNGNVAEIQNIEDNELELAILQYHLDKNAPFYKAMEAHLDKSKKSTPTTDKVTFYDSCLERIKNNKIFASILLVVFLLGVLMTIAKSCDYFLAKMLKRNSEGAKSSKADVAKPDLAGKDDEITLQSLFKSDFNDRLLTSGREEAFQSVHDGTEVKIKSKVYYDFEAQTKFISFYIPSDPNTFEICKSLVEYYKEIFEREEGVAVETKGPHLQPVSKSELKFSGRIFVYHEYPLFEQKKRELFDLYKNHGLSIQFRGAEYVWSQKSNKEDFSRKH
jgi:hypothetical protein